MHELSLPVGWLSFTCSEALRRDELWSKLFPGTERPFSYETHSTVLYCHLDAVGQTYNVIVNDKQPLWNKDKIQRFFQCHPKF